MNECVWDTYLLELDALVSEMTASCGPGCSHCDRLGALVASRMGYGMKEHADETVGVRLADVGPSDPDATRENPRCGKARVGAGDSGG